MKEVQHEVCMDEISPPKHSAMQPYRESSLTFKDSNPTNHIVAKGKFQRKEILQNSYAIPSYQISPHSFISSFVNLTTRFL
jgi:hypothetical protein